MFERLVMWESMQIDNVKRKWAFRGLFLFVFFIAAAFMIWPIGNTDFVFFENWLLSVSESEAFLQGQVIAIPREIWGIFLYSISVLLFHFFLLLLCMVSMVLIFSDTREKAFPRSFFPYLKKGFFLLLVLLPCYCASLFFPTFGDISLNFIKFAILCAVASVVFLVPCYILFENKNPIDAIILSFQVTKGRRFFVFLNFLSLYSLHSLLQIVMAQFLPNNVEVAGLVYGFLTAFFVLSLGRMCFLLYDRLTKKDSIVKDAVDTEPLEK